MEKMGISDKSITQAVTVLLGVFSVVLLQIFSLWWIVPATGEQREWYIFISLGLVLLPLIWVVSVIDESRFFPFKLSTVKIFAIFLGIFPLTWVLYKTLSLMVIIFSLGHWFALTYFLKRETRFNDMFSSLYLLFAVLVSWSFASRLIWWDGFDTFILRSPFTILILVISSLIIFWALSDSPSSRPSKRFNLVATSIIITVVFGIISFRMDMFLGYSSINHWAVYVSPAEMVKQGGWLLWDVPSQYGFLSILFIAWFPAKTTWHALYYLNGTFIFLSTVILFFMLRGIRPGLLNAGFALFITMAAVFFLPGWAPELKGGPQAFPSVGAYRFIWCFALLGVLAMITIRQKDPKALFRYLVLGSGIWIVGSLWSFESALFCSVTWFLPFVLFLGHLIPSYFKRRSKRAQFGYFVLGVTAPILFFGIVILFISLIYLIQLGHLPDFFSFIEYSLSFSKDEFGSLPMDPYGALWFFLLVFCILGALGITLLRGGFPLSGSATALIGASCALWVTSSYFIGRSHENNVTNLVSVVCFVVVLAIIAVKQSSTQSLGKAILKVTVIPIFAVIMVSVYGHGSFKNLVKSVYNGYSTPLDHYLYSRSPFYDDFWLQDLLTLAKYKAGDPIVYFGPHSGISNLPHGLKDFMKTITQAQIWSPITPDWLIAPLIRGRPDRVSVYIDRFSERSRLSGWLLLRLVENTRELNTLVLEKLQVNYNLGRKFQNGNWGLVWVQRKL